MSTHFKSRSDDSIGLQMDTGRIPQVESKRSVFMATTALWDIDPHFFQCCLKAQQELLIKSLTGKGVINGRFPELHAGECPVGRSRNSLTAAFLKSDCTDILFIDSDLIFSACQIERIVQHEAEVVGGCYMFKAEGQPRACTNPKPGITGPDANGLMEVSYMGTGFLRVRRSVFDRIIEAFGDDLLYVTDDGTQEVQYDFWRMGVHEYKHEDFKYDEKVTDKLAASGMTLEKAQRASRRRWLSEDWQFCEFCRMLDIPVYADMKILLGHSGHAVYPLKTQVDFLYPNKVSASAPVDAATAGVGVTSPASMPAHDLKEVMA